MSKTELKLNQAITEYLRRAALSETTMPAHLFGTGAASDLEQKIAAYYGKKHALGVANATTGLLALGLALNLKNSEFVTSPYNFGGSLASWLILGGKAVFADIETETLTVNPKKIRQMLTKKTRAILATDILGNPSNSLALRNLADESGIWYIADCAQSFGASRAGFPASHWADALVISFTAGKTLFAGEGGAIITDNTELYEKLLFYSQHPFRQKRELGLGVVNEFGINGRIHPLAAIWANTCFEESLGNLRTYQNECFKVLECLNQSGLTEPENLRAKNIFPSFFRLTVERKSNSDEQSIENYLIEQGFRVKTAPVPVSVIYQNEAFLAQYKKQFFLPEACFAAERQAAQRIGLVFTKNGGHEKKR